MPNEVVQFKTDHRIFAAIVVALVGRSIQLVRDLLQLQLQIQGRFIPQHPLHFINRFSNFILGDDLFGFALNSLKNRVVRQVKFGERIVNERYSTFAVTCCTKNPSTQ